MPLLQSYDCPELGAVSFIDKKQDNHAKAIKAKPSDIKIVSPVSGDARKRLQREIAADIEKAKEPENDARRITQVHARKSQAL